MEIHHMPGHLIRRLQQVSSQLFHQRVAAAGFDLTPVQFAAMQALSEAPGLEQARLAALIAYDKATIGGVVDRLERKGMVTRIASERDRRARQVSLSAAGQGALDALTPVVVALQSEILGRLDPPEQQAFIRLAQKAIGNDLLATPKD